MATTEDRRGSIVELAAEVQYAQGSVVSKTLLDKKTGTLTLFAFDKGQNLSEHTSPYDATVIVLDGAAELTIGGEKLNPKVGEMVIMPADVAHSVHANAPFKMLLIMIR